MPLPRIAKAHNILTASGREQISKQWEFGVPKCWAGLVTRKYGEKTFKVRFIDVYIAAARAPHMAPKQAYGGGTQAHRQA